MKLTTGTTVVDTLIDDVRVGDNLVVQGEPGAPLDLLVRRFIDAMQGIIPLVRINLATPYEGPAPTGTTVLDWSALKTGTVLPHPGALPADATLDDALQSLRDADDHVGPGAAFVIDGLAQAQHAWGADAALELFLWTCPRLYRRRSVALWPIEVAVHKPTFLRRLSEITQVVIELAPEAAPRQTEAPDPDSTEPPSRAWAAPGATDAAVRLTVRKADGRRADVVGRTVVAAVADADLHTIGAPTTARQHLGTMLHDRRLARGLAQAEVARQVGISPSALSQIERGVRGPSGDTLVRLWEVLGVPFGPTTDTAPYRIARRSGRKRRALQPGLTAELIIDDAPVGQLWLLEIAAGASGDRAPFAVKSPEVITILRGVLDLLLEGRRETLSEGDALVTTTTAVTGWTNPATASAEVLWSIHPPAVQASQPG